MCNVIRFHVMVFVNYRVCCSSALLRVSSECLYPTAQLIQTVQSVCWHVTRSVDGTQRPEPVLLCPEWGLKCEFSLLYQYLKLKLRSWTVILVTIWAKNHPLKKQRSVWPSVIFVLFYFIFWISFYFYIFNFHFNFKLSFSNYTFF